MIKKLSKIIPIQFTCDYFYVSRSSYYYWRNKEKPVTLKTKEEICNEIELVFKESKQSYGSPRVTKELKERDFIVSENTVAKYMKELGLDARHRKPFKIQTTDSSHEDPIAPRVFKTEDKGAMPTSSGEVLAGDITYLKTTSGFLYLAVVIDLYNREVVGWSMSDSLDTSIVLKALEYAMKKVGPDAEVTFHSDRGSQYASEAYRKFLKHKEITPSMSRKGNCYDNAYVESWFAGLKKERIYRYKNLSKNQMRSLVFEYIETWYNLRRRHSSLDYHSPVEYRLINQLA